MSVWGSESDVFQRVGGLYCVMIRGFEASAGFEEVKFCIRSKTSIQFKSKEK